MTTALVNEETPSPEWPYMDSLQPPVYVCLRRKPSSDGKFHRMLIDGRCVCSLCDCISEGDGNSALRILSRIQVKTALTTHGLHFI